MIRIAVAHVSDSRDDFFAKREALFEEEKEKLAWLRAKVDLFELPAVRSDEEVGAFAAHCRQADVQALIIHIPIWADPILSVKLHNQVGAPVLLLGNTRPDTSSMVGMLGAGGALDQVGYPHVRVVDHPSEAAKVRVMAFLRAAATYKALRGQRLGLFGSRSLGIATATADPAQVQKLFGVDVQGVDQSEIKEAAIALSEEESAHQRDWLAEQVGSITYCGTFTPEKFDAQTRSYVATRQLAEEYGFDFVGVKCQPEMSDGYVSQCVAHMLMNGELDADGKKKPIVHACEADADGALTMQILHLLSGGLPTALVDIRWFDEDTGTWTLANCGALSASFLADDADPTGLSNVEVIPHVFGAGGGGALPGIVSPGTVTLARLCRRDGEYWMAIVLGAVQPTGREALSKTTSAFPQAIIKAPIGMEFAAIFGSNHIHMVRGNYVDELEQFCRLAGVPCQVWR